MQSISHTHQVFRILHWRTIKRALAATPGHGDAYYEQLESGIREVRGWMRGPYTHVAPTSIDGVHFELEDSTSWSCSHILVPDPAILFAEYESS
jgi:hypothetical protein